MKARFTDSMNWLHTWAGLVVGWLLFAVFLTGTLAYFQYEITRWMQPELPEPAPAIQAIQHAQHYLEQHAAGAERWTIVLPGDRGLTTDLFWRPVPVAAAEGTPTPRRRFERVSLNGQGEPATARETRGGQFFYRFHFDLHYMPVIWARWLVGFCSMLMLLALLTGMVIHKKIFKDFFTLQWFKGHKSWLDAHTITSVLALPFHLMITYTGLITLMFLYMTLAISSNYENNQAFFNELASRNAEVKASGTAAPLQPLQNILAQAQNQLHGADISFINVIHPGDQAAVVELREAPTAGLTAGATVLRYAGATTQPLTGEMAPSVPEQVRQTLINLHAGRFADPLLRWLYFLSGLAGSAMIGTGLLLWSARRSTKSNSSPLGQRLVHALNGGTLLGLPLAVAGYFWANRLIPTVWPNRADLEIKIFFACWLLMLLYSLVRPAKRLWPEGLIILAAAFTLLPLLNMLTSPQHLGHSLSNGQWVFAAIDLSFLLTGLLCWQSAKILYRRQQSTTAAMPIAVRGKAS